jgi:hypothetical protein
LRAFERSRAWERRNFERELSRDLEKGSPGMKLKNQTREKLRKQRIADALNEKRKVAREKE